MGMWLDHGGMQATASWGVENALLWESDVEALIAAAHETVPPAHCRWVAELPIRYRLGDYSFVHAGVQLGVSIDRPREPFLRSKATHDVFVVHGHRISESVEFRGNRLGIDTGAYASGRLTDVGLEGRECWILQIDASAEAGGGETILEKR